MQLVIGLMFTDGFVPFFGISKFPGWLFLLYDNVCPFLISGNCRWSAVWAAEQFTVYIHWEPYIPKADVTSFPKSTSFEGMRKNFSLHHLSFKSLHLDLPLALFLPDLVCLCFCCIVYMCTLFFYLYVSLCC